MRKLVIGSENAEFQIIQSLKLNRSKRNKTCEIFIEGTECIKQALKADLEITRIIMADINRISDWAAGVIQAHEQAKIIEMSPHLYAALSDRTNPSELLITAKVKAEKLNGLNLSECPFIVAFDRPSDFGNLGSIVRSANAFNVDAIFIIGHGIDVHESKVIRASLGSVFHTRIVYIESMQALDEFIKKEKERTNMLVIGTDSRGSVSIKHKRLKKPVMVIVGNEAKGMSVHLKGICDEVVQIPISGSVNSLNAACAASIVMWEIYRNSQGSTDLFNRE
ncbi:MAG: RNA methyltransferase [Treponema sp.]|jgi:TrmH family RNA methyltransferase|nr:RNA methyltransferase [Treponema sp.]